MAAPNRRDLKAERAVRFREVALSLSFGAAFGIIGGAYATASEGAAERLKRDLVRLAADDMAGRETGTKGYRAAADAVEREFKAIGL